MFAHRGFISGENQLRADVAERFENKATVRQARMGEGEDVPIDRDITKVEDVEIKNARGIPLGDGDAADVVFDPLSRFEKFVRAADEVDLNDGIVKVTRLGRAVYGIALVNAGLKVVRALRHEVDEEIAPFAKVGESVAEIGAERDACAMCHECLFKAEDILHVVEAGLLVRKPERSTHCARGEGHA